MGRAATLAAAAAVAAIVLLCSSSAAAATNAGNSGNAREPPLAPGLSLDFYKRSCPKAESIVRRFVQDAVRRDVGLAAGLLRLHFHDCFVQGCDASVLLDGSATGPGEQQAPPNLSLRATAFKAINDIHRRLQKQCGGRGRGGPVVSCADVLALAARDSVVASGGPSYKVPLGRRDSASFATQEDVLDGLPPPTAAVPELLAVLSKINLDATDLVALSGGHTIGLGHCASFEDRLFPRPDPTLNATFAAHLRRTCPVKGADRKIMTPLDVRTPTAFDNMYYVNLVNREGLFTSDQDLFTNPGTRPLVEKFARSQRDFFDQFAFSVVKMGQIKVLTGTQGQIRTNCSARNAGTGGGMPWSILEEAESLVF